MLDYHTHVWPHAPGTPNPTYDELAAYCERAAEFGVTEVAITEHCHRFTTVVERVFPHWERARLGPLAEATDHILVEEGGGDLDAYVSTLVDAKDRGLPIKVGFEVDYLPGTTEAMAELVGEYPFDVLLGSVHWLDAWLFDAYGIPAFLEPWENGDVDAAWARYADAIEALIASGVTDVLAHLDVIKVAGYAPTDVSAFHDRIVAAVAAGSMSVEISTAGLRKPAADLYPAEPLLSRLVDAGVIFTTASDAHTLEQLGSGYDGLPAVLERLGIEELASYSSRIPTPRPWR